MNFKSVLKPEGSTMASLATVGSVFAVYNLSAGSIAGAHASDANHNALESSRKKAGYIAFGLVSGLFLLTRDGNVATLGYASIVGMEIAYRHAIMADPATGKVVQPVSLDAFTPAGADSTGNVVPLSAADASGY